LSILSAVISNDFITTFFNIFSGIHLADTSSLVFFIQQEIYFKV